MKVAGCHICYDGHMPSNKGSSKEDIGPPNQSYDDAYRLLEDLPTGLPAGEDLRSRVDIALPEELPEIIKRIHDIRDQRAAILHKTFIGSRYLQAHPEEFTEVRHAVDAVREYSDNQSNRLGSGRVAEVYKNPNFSHVCAKVVRNMTRYRTENSVDVETGFLEDLADLNVDGARTPHPYGFIEDINLRAIVMERLHAISVDDLTSRRAHILFSEEFDPARFVGTLSRYVEAMHDLGIYHGDLHEGNVMVSINAPHTPYVIDFGLSKKIYFSEEVKDEPEKDRRFLPQISAKLKAWRENIDK